MRYYSTIQFGHLLCILLLTLFSCSANKENRDPPLVEPDQGGDQLSDFIRKYYEDMSSRDWNTYRTYFWDNATITTVWALTDDSDSTVNIISIDEFIKQTPDGPDSQPIFREWLISMRSDVQGDMAVVWTKYGAEFGSKENLHTWEGTDLFCLLKFKDEWRIVSLTFMPDESGAELTYCKQLLPPLGNS